MNTLPQYGDYVVVSTLDYRVVEEAVEVLTDQARDIIAKSCYGSRRILFMKGVAESEGKEYMYVAWRTKSSQVNPSNTFLEKII